MVELFISALLVLVMSISSAAGISTPASDDDNPSDEVKSAASEVLDYVKSNHPVGNGDNEATSSAGLAVSDRAPEEPKQDGKTFGESVSTQAKGEKTNTPEIEESLAAENSDFGKSIADSQPDLAKTDGKEFGKEISNQLRP